MKRLSVCLALATLLLPACGRLGSPTPEPRTFTEEEVVEALNGLVEDVRSVTDIRLGEALVATAHLPLGSAGCPQLENIFTLITFTSTAELGTASAAVTTLSGTVLTRGTYRYDPVTDTCTVISDTDNLVLHYPYETPDGTSAEAELTVDWEVSSDTLDVADPNGALAEVPTSMNVKLVANGDSVTNLDIELSWYNTAECGTEEGLLEPTSVSVSGKVGSLSLTNVGYSLSEDALNVQGEMSAEAGLEVSFALRADGEPSRNPCFSSGFEVETATLELEVASSITEESNSFRLEMALSEFVFAFPEGTDDDMVGLQGIAAVTVGGSLTIDGDAAGSFSGVLDDSNDNGVSGENVRITFSAGGTTTLEDFLLENDFGVTFPPFDRALVSLTVP